MDLSGRKPISTEEKQENEGLFCLGYLPCLL